LLAQNRTIAYLQVVYRLGVLNVSRVILYRLLLKIGYYRWRLPTREVIGGAFFVARDLLPQNQQPTHITYFSAHPIDVLGTPDWFVNPWQSHDQQNTKIQALKTQHWSEIEDFSSLVGDIKTIWEPSRFDWMPKLAWQYTTNKADSNKIESLELWLRDWLLKNPTNCGINWKCGQETALRMLNLLLTVDILRDDYPPDASNLERFLIDHLERIIPTTLYAKAQDNNHGTSEAVALFCGGLYLTLYGSDNCQALGSRATRIGRSLLENRVRSLILNDGSFAQLSVNYHRLMLDTITFCELYREFHGADRFSVVFYKRLRLATQWLDAMTDPSSGDAANLGANDGAYFANLADQDYRNFNPTLQRSMVVFCKQQSAQPCDDALLNIYGVNYHTLETAQAVGSVNFPDGGFARLALPAVGGHCIFRYPKYRFRPGNCDANHVDIWIAGKNITLDAGSYSYFNNDESMSGYFAGTSGHCTIKFDDRDQMPNLSRMLRTNWLQPSVAEFDAHKGQLCSSYQDHKGAWHKRSLHTTDKGLIIRDEFGGFDNQAELLWRLPVFDWKIEDNKVAAKDIEISFNSDAEYTMDSCLEHNSLHYLEVHSAFVVKLCFVKPASVETLFKFELEA